MSLTKEQIESLRNVMTKAARAGVSLKGEDAGDVARKILVAVKNREFAATKNERDAIALAVAKGASTENKNKFLKIASEVAKSTSKPTRKTSPTVDSLVTSATPGILQSLPSSRGKITKDMDRKEKERIRREAQLERKAKRHEIYGGATAKMIEYNVKSIEELHHAIVKFRVYMGRLPSKKLGIRISGSYQEGDKIQSIAPRTYYNSDIDAFEHAHHMWLMNLPNFFRARGSRAPGARRSWAADLNPRYIPRNGALHVWIRDENFDCPGVLDGNSDLTDAQFRKTIMDLGMGITAETDDAYGSNAFQFAKEESEFQRAKLADDESDKSDDVYRSARGVAGTNTKTSFLEQGFALEGSLQALLNILTKIGYPHNNDEHLGLKVKGVKGIVPSTALKTLLESRSFWKITKIVEGSRDKTKVPTGEKENNETTIHNLNKLGNPNYDPKVEAHRQKNERLAAMNKAHNKRATFTVTSGQITSNSYRTITALNSYGSKQQFEHAAALSNENVRAVMMREYLALRYLKSLVTDRYPTESTKTSKKSKATIGGQF